MKQLSFNFMNSQENKEIKSLDFSDIQLTEEQLLQEANAIADTCLNISGMDALCMAARGDFYGTDLEGSILHSNLQRITYLLGWHNIHK